MPWDLPLGTATVVVSTAAGTSAPVTVSVSGQTPGLISQAANGSGPAVIVNARTGALVTPDNPIARGAVATLYCLGLGAVTNPAPTGAAASSGPLSVTLSPPAILIGGVPARVLFSGLSPGSVSLYQVNLEIPNGAPLGSAVEVRLSINDVASNVVSVRSSA